MTILISWTEFAQKGHFQSNTHKKMNITIEFCKIELVVLGIKFQFKLTILICWPKFSQKGYFWSKTEEVNIPIEFYIFELF